MPVLWRCQKAVCTMVLQYASNQLPRPCGLPFAELLPSVGDDLGKPRHNCMVIIGRFGWAAMGESIERRMASCTRRSSGEWQQSRNWLTSNTVSSQSLASIFSCLRLSESPTSRTTLGRPDGLGTSATPASACFFLDQSWNAGGRKVKPRLKLCVPSNILVDPMSIHPGGSAACGCGVIAQEQRKGHWPRRHWPLRGVDLACT